MRVPLAWLREYVELPADAQSIADMLAKIGFPVDAIEERPLVTGVVAGHIEQLDKHPNADRLHVGTINVGNGALLTIATAATNVAAGQTIAVATIGAQLPSLKIERRKMRGVESEGMMISAEELALPAEWFEDGIMQFDATISPGTDVVEYFRLGDAVLDVDITTNRVDAMSMVGLARELAAYQGVTLRLPALDYSASSTNDPQVTIETVDCRRFVAQCFSNIRVDVSPAWMRIRLALAGQRPINNIVDISNYVMLETGQPLHFYDEARIPNRHLIVRDAQAKEILITLDGEPHELAPSDIVIASERAAEGLAGLKGGKDSEVASETTAILLESANFTGARVRRMSTRLGIRTDASSRHEKSLPLVLTDFGQQRAAHLLTSQGAQAHRARAFGEDVLTADPVTLDLRDIKRLLGYELNAQDVRDYLDRLGFKAEPKDVSHVLLTPPPWRRDVAVSADVIEEIARMAGYDRIEAIIPAIGQHAIASDDFELEGRIANTLAALGYNEIMTIAMHGAQIFERLNRVGLPPTVKPVEVLNPISEEQRYLRFALGPAFMEYFARFNHPVRVFELGHTFYSDDGQPVENAMLSFGFTAKPYDEPQWRDTHFLQLKSDVEALMHAVTGRRDYQYTDDVRNGAHPGKTAAMLLDGREVAVLCQVDPRMLAAFDVRLPAYGCWIYLQRIPEYRWARYHAPSKYPGTYRDLALVCDRGLSAARVEKTIVQSIGTLCTGAWTFDEYRGAQIPGDKKSLAVRVTLQRMDRTITDEEADGAIERAVIALREQLGAILRT
jgi:phenylalanyl-tRNA synthetase beta chain